MRFTSFPKKQPNPATETPPKVADASESNLSFTIRNAYPRCLFRPHLQKFAEGYEWLGLCLFFGDKKKDHGFYFVFIGSLLFEEKGTTFFLVATFGLLISKWEGPTDFRNRSTAALKLTLVPFCVMLSRLYAGAIFIELFMGF